MNEQGSILMLRLVSVENYYEQPDSLIQEYTYC